jgi:hypothetical protein
MMADEQDQPHEDDVVNGEVVAEFRSDTLMHLPKVGDKTEPGAAEPAESMDRRRFVSRLVVGGAAALAFGGGIALVANGRRKDTETGVLPYGTQLETEDGTVDIQALVDQITDLDYQLKAMTAERDECVSNLTASTNEIEQLNKRIEELEAQNGDLLSLNSLWQALDDIGLDNLVASALGVIGTALVNAMKIVNLLQTGLNRGGVIISQFVSLLPGPQAGFAWLQEQIDLLGINLDNLSEKVQEAVDSTGQLANQIADFVLWVLDKLPFGTGNKARASMESMQLIISGLPDLIDGITTSIFDPLLVWFGADDDNNLVGILLDPIEKHFVEPAEDVLAELKQFETDFEENLAAPVNEALAQRNAIRANIEELQARIGYRV